jgi:predicted CXXCH cytochrome family protein
MRLSFSDITLRHGTSVQLVACTHLLKYCSRRRAAPRSAPDAQARFRVSLVGLRVWRRACCIVRRLRSCVTPWQAHVILAMLLCLAGCLRGREATFVGRRACIACHQSEYSVWKGSHHDLAMTVATEATVLGDFSGATFTRFGISSRFFRRDGKFFVNTEGPDGKFADFEIKYTFGWDPLQQYLIQFPGGRLQALTVAWDTRHKRWFDLYPKERIRPDDPLFWTRRLLNWNYMCAECHSTHLEKNYDLATRSYRTMWSEIDVSCEACHGPGSRHVTLERSTIGRWLAGPWRGLTVKLKGADNRTQLNVCAPCHSRRRVIDSGYVHGAPFMDYYVPELLSGGIYFPDGQILEEDYEYGSFAQSKMYRKGVRCSDCHEPHSLKLRAQGNALCVRCHDAHRFNTKAHHFHEPGTAGSRCIDCHMPTRTYMVVDVRRDHFFRVPRPDLSVELGTPNACNQCHSDKSAQWAAEAIRTRYGPPRQSPFDYGRVFALGRAHKPEAMPELVRIAQDPDRSAMARATAVSLLRGYADAKAMGAMSAVLRDPDPLVRFTAVGAGERLAPDKRLRLLSSALRDPSRCVRVEAARVLASVPSNMFGRRQRVAFDSALNEYIHGQNANGDAPEAHLNLGGLWSDLGDSRHAEDEYRIALRLDPMFVPARVNLAILLAGQGRLGESERELRDAIASAPNSGEAHYSLGLLLAERAEHDSDLMPEAATELLKAAALMPNLARVHYNAALAQERIGRPVVAEAQLLEANRLDPDSADILSALTIFYLQRQDWQQAAKFARDLSRHHPDYPGAQALLQQSFSHNRVR